MWSFFDDNDLARSILIRIFSYSASLLDVGKSSRMAYSTLSSVEAFSYKPTPALV